MNIFKLAMLVVSAWLLLTYSGLAVDNGSVYIGDAEYGRGLAERWCASCHLVSAGQQHAVAGAPPFATIAQSPNFNADRLAHQLLAPHPNMAKLALSRSAVNDIAAYIISLKK